MLKTLHIYGMGRANVKKYSFKSFSKTKKSIFLLACAKDLRPFRNCNNNSNFRYVPNSAKESFTMNKELLNFYKDVELCTKENSKNVKEYLNSSETFWSGQPSLALAKGRSTLVRRTKGNFMPSATFYKSSNFSHKKKNRVMVKRLWFFDTAAPIPGVSSLKKKKRLYSMKSRAFKTLISWIQI